LGTGLPSQANDMKATARQLLRQWLAREGDAVATVDGLGREAIRAAAQASARLDRGTAASESSQNVLRELEALAQAHAQTHAPGRARRLPFGWGSRAVEPAAPDLNALVASLERERDNVARALIAIETDKAKLLEAETGLDDALALIHACQAAIEAAARELAIERPDRAQFLSGTLAPRLVERERDVLTQLAVTRQGGLALQLVAEGQEALGQAIERARDTSVAALRTAMAARQAIAGNRDLLDQAQALERTADAARGASTSGRDVESALADALAQVRRAIDAAQAPPRPL
jgi:hypothetical protein